MTLAVDHKFKYWTRAPTHTEGFQWELTIHHFVSHQMCH